MQVYSKKHWARGRGHTRDAGWHTHLILNPLREAETGSLWVWDEPELQSKTLSLKLKNQPQIGSYSDNSYLIIFPQHGIICYHPLWYYFFLNLHSLLPLTFLTMEFYHNSKLWMLFVDNTLGIVSLGFSFCCFIFQDGVYTSDSLWTT